MQNFLKNVTFFKKQSAHRLFDESACLRYSTYRLIARVHSLVFAVTSSNKRQALLLIAYRYYIILLAQCQLLFFFCFVICCKHFCFSHFNYYIMLKIICQHLFLLFGFTKDVIPRNNHQNHCPGKLF